MGFQQNTQFTENGAEESICRLYQMQKLRDEEDNVSLPTFLPSMYSCVFIMIVFFCGGGGSTDF